MILCHKDGGLLTWADEEDVTGLLQCGCISGYVRGFEPWLNRQEAIVRQIKSVESRIKLYEDQKRSEKEIDLQKEVLERLRQLK